MKLAWIENDQVRDVCHGIPSECYTEEIANYYTTEVNDDIVNGATLIDNVWTNPPPIIPIQIVEVKTWNNQIVRENLTLAERVKWDNDSSNTIKTAKIEFNANPELTHTTEVLQLLVDAGDISQATMTKILT
jgi:hypothetical protein